MIRTTVVGSYPQPDWLIDRERLKTRLPPRVGAAELWRVRADLLHGAQDDATILAVRDMERAGVDVVTDGEMRRESYSNHFATALAGLDLENPGSFVERVGATNMVPRVVGPIRRVTPVELRHAQFLKDCTNRATKITVPGPFTMAQQCQDEFYGDQRALALDYARAVNEEMRDLAEVGLDCVQIDEPYLQARPEAAREYAVEAINCALDGVNCRTALHTCFGYAHFARDKKSTAGYPFLSELNDIVVDELVLESAEPNLDLALLGAIATKTVVLGVVSVREEHMETVEEIQTRVRAALEFLPRERLMVAPDCGMKYLSRDTAYRKLTVMVEAVHDL